MVKLIVIMSDKSQQSLSDFVSFTAKHFTKSDGINHLRSKTY